MKWIFAFLMLPFIASAQQPFGKNATWHYYFDQFGPRGYISLTYEKDTLMKGLDWQQFKTAGISHLRIGPHPQNDLIETIIDGYFYLSTRNDSVFRMLPDTTPQLLYDFSAGIGDSWQYGELDTITGCKDTPIATVVDIGYDTLQGYPAKYWEISLPLDSLITPWDTIFGCSASECLHTKIYRDFGTTWFTDLFEPDLNYCQYLKTATTVRYYQMRCFSSPDMSLSFTNQACDYWSLISVDELEISDLKIYPNPTQDGHIEIETNRPIHSIQVMDITGRIVFEHQQNRSIQLPTSSGLYLLKIEFKGGEVLIEKVIRE